MRPSPVDRCGSPALERRGGLRRLRSRRCVSDLPHRIDLPSDGLETRGSLAMFIIVFEVLPAPGRKDAYLNLAGHLRPMLDTMDGFISVERFESRQRPGWVLSLSTWRDEKSVVRWRVCGEHHRVQTMGRGGIFSDYRLRVGEITADDQPPAGHTVREQRLDATEVGAAKAMTIGEWTPEAGGPTSLTSEAIAEAAGVEAAAGPVAHDIFDSIYTPGRAVLLASWATPAEADAFEGGHLSGTARRRRSLRVIRDYGMFDRREAPQFYPDVRADQLAVM